MHCLPLEKCGLGQKFPSTITVSRSFSSYSGLFGYLWREFWGRGPGGIPDCYLTRYVTLGLRDFLQKQRESSSLQKLWSGGCVIRAIRNSEREAPRKTGLFLKFPIKWTLGLGQTGSQPWLLERPAREEQALDLGMLWITVSHLCPTCKQTRAFLLETLARPVWGAAWEATPAYKVTGQALWRARHSNKKPEPGGQRGVLGLEKHSQAFFCLTGEKRKSKGPSSACGAGTALAHNWPGRCCRRTLRSELQTSAGFFLAGRKGNFPPVTDRNNGFGASLGLQRLPWKLMEGHVN